MEDINLTNEEYKDDNKEKEKLEDYTILRNSIEYYDNKCLEINKIKEKIKYIQFIRGYGSNMDEIILYDDDYNIILKSKTQILGRYFKKRWNWGWSLINETSNRTTLSRKIFDYAWNLTNKKEFFLKKELLTSDLYLKHNIEVDLKIALSTYIIKKYFILQFPVLTPEDYELDEYTRINYKKLINNKEYINNPSIRILYFVLIDY
jgi:hypothetical protein